MSSAWSDGGRSDSGRRTDPRDSSVSGTPIGAAKAATKPSTLTELPALTLAQKRLASECLAQLQQADGWRVNLPVLLLNRCWLRLTVIPMQRLPIELPPDLSRAAPELVRYGELIDGGCPAHLAQQHCWLEFGPEAFHQALQRLWTVQEHGPHLWTLERYLDLLTDYRQRFALERPRPVPLLVLARPSGRPLSPTAVDVDGLFWLRPGLALGEPSMRHTCA